MSTFVSLGSRIFIIILLTWACVHPYAIFTLLFSPDSIVNSVELQTYEGVLSILIPVLLVIPFISTIIKISKHAKLEEILKLEEIRRSGLSEEEVKLLQENEPRQQLKKLNLHGIKMLQLIKRVKRHKMLHLDKILNFYI